MENKASEYEEQKKQHDVVTIKNMVDVAMTKFKTEYTQTKLMQRGCSDTHSEKEYFVTICRVDIGRF